MSKKALTFIIIVITILVAISFLKSNKLKSSDKKENSILINFNPAEIKEIKISNKKKEVFLRKVTSGSWVVDSLFKYPASLSKINAALLKIAMLSSSQLVTANKDNYEYLGLTEEKTRIALISDKDVKLGIDIGQERKGNLKTGGETGRYVKTLNKDEVYLVGEDISLESENKSWLKTRILNFKKKEIKKITLLQTKPKLVIELLISEKTKPDDEPEFILKGINKGDKEKQNEINRIISGLTELSLDNIYPQEHENMKKLKFIKLLQITMVNKAVYNFSAAEEKEKFYLKIELNNNALSKDNADIELARRLSSWVYLLKYWDSAIFKKKYVDLVEVPEEKSKEKDMESIHKKKIVEQHPMSETKPMLSEQSEVKPSL